MLRRLAIGAFVVLLSASAFAGPEARDGGAAATTTTTDMDPAVELVRLDLAARRAEISARDGRARVTTLGAVAKLAKSKVDTLTGSDRAEVEEGLVHLLAHVANVDAAARGDERAAAEYRAGADKLRARLAAPGKADTNACDPPFSFDPEGHKRWKPECF